MIFDRRETVKSKSWNVDKLDNLKVRKIVVV